MVETEQAKDKKQHLLDVWFNRIEAETRFCVRTTVEADDEWLHSFYYFNDTIPTDVEFEKTVGDYLTFEFSMIMQNRENLFQIDEDAKKSLTEIEKLTDKEWDEFFLIDIFPILKRGKRLIKNNQIKGGIPYVSSSGLNNGIDNFIGNDNDVRIFSNCLTIANSGRVGASFYHAYKFVASDHVTHLKNKEFDQYIYIYLFIATQTSRFSEKYNFNREINNKRISREKIILPINQKSEPDYEYMRQYIKNLMYKKRKQYLSYLNSK